MRRPILVLSVAVSFPLAALAQSSDIYECTMSGLTRRVEVVHETAAPVPCEVRYHKEDEAPGAPQVLWSASSQAGYCETQAESLVERLEGFGWQCDAEDTGGPAAAPASAVQAPAESDAAGEDGADDTDVLLAPRG